MNCLQDRIVVVPIIVVQEQFILKWKEFNINDCKFKIVHPQRGETRTRTSAKLFQFAKYIAKNYNNLSKYTIFLSDYGPNYQSSKAWSELIKINSPSCRTPLGELLNNHNNPITHCIHNKRQCDIQKMEQPYIDKIREIFNVKIPRVISFLDKLSCNDFILSDTAIKLYPKKIYIRLMNETNKFPSGLWNNAFERLQGTLYDDCIKYNKEL